jgi:hypothetical protein
LQEKRGRAKKEPPKNEGQEVNAGTWNWHTGKGKKINGYHLTAACLIAPVLPGRHIKTGCRITDDKQKINYMALCRDTPTLDKAAVLVVSDVRTLPVCWFPFTFAFSNTADISPNLRVACIFTIRETVTPRP